MDEPIANLVLLALQFAKAWELSGLSPAVPLSVSWICQQNERFICSQAITGLVLTCFVFDYAYICMIGMLVKNSACIHSKHSVLLGLLPFPSPFAVSLAQRIGTVDPTYNSAANIRLHTKVKIEAVPGIL